MKRISREEQNYTVLELTKTINTRGCQHSLKHYEWAARAVGLDGQSDHHTPHMG